MRRKMSVGHVPTVGLCAAGIRVLLGLKVKLVHGGGWFLANLQTCLLCFAISPASPQVPLHLFLAWKLPHSSNASCLSPVPLLALLKATIELCKDIKMSSQCLLFPLLFPPC